MCGQVGVGHNQHAGQRDGVWAGGQEAGRQDPRYLQGSHHISRTIGQQPGDIPPQLAQAQLDKGVPGFLVQARLGLAVKPCVEYWVLF